jgi:hypothetical protein
LHFVEGTKKTTKAPGREKNIYQAEIRKQKFPDMKKVMPFSRRRFVLQYTVTLIGFRRNKGQSAARVEIITAMLRELKPSGLLHGVDC